MSRATTPATSNNTVTTKDKKIYLSVKNGAYGASLIASRIPFVAAVPCIEMTLGEYHTFRLFMFHIFRGYAANDGLRFGKEIINHYAIMNHMLRFLYQDIAALMPNKSLEDAALGLYRPTNVFMTLSSCKESVNNIWKIPGNYFFHMSLIHKIRFFTHPVLTAAFNANLDGSENPDRSKNNDGLKQHLESLSPHARKYLLSQKGTITIEHLKERYPKITRTGTALQMAIYGDDEDMVDYLKTQMDEDEFHAQCREVFENAINNTTPEIKTTLKDEIASLKNKQATTEDYFNVMRKVQQAEVEALCAGLEIFNDANFMDFIFDTRYVVSTRSEKLRNSVDDFVDNKILPYVKTHPIHNPYLLQKVYLIYDKLRGLSPLNFKRQLYFSQKIIGGIQSFLSPRWLQHFTQDIEDLVQGNNSIMPHRSFICGDGSDIRKLVASSVGRDSFLTISGKGVFIPSRMAHEPNIIAHLQNLGEAKKARYFQAYLCMHHAKVHGPLSTILWLR